MFAFDKFTCQEPICCEDPPLIYGISSSNTLPTTGSTSFSAPGLSSTVTEVGSKRAVTVTDINAVANYTASIYAKNGYEVEFFTSEVKISVVCHENSARVRGLYVNLGLEKVQRVDAGLPTTNFDEYQIESTFSPCPLESVKFVERKDKSLP